MTTVPLFSGFYGPNCLLGLCLQKADQPSYVSPLLLGFLLFVLVGSSFFQVLRTAQGGPVF
jgi:hypothetical protein